MQRRSARIRNASSFIEVWKQEKETYPLIFRLAQSIQVFPYSTVSIERSFSSITDIKTIKRNRLGVRNLEACLLIKQDFGQNDIPLTSDIVQKYSTLNDGLSLSSKKITTTLDTKILEKIDELQDEERLNFEQEENKDDKNEENYVEQFGEPSIISKLFYDYMNSAKSNFHNLLKHYPEMKDEKPLYSQNSLKRKPTDELLKSDIKQSKPNSQKSLGKDDFKYLDPEEDTSTGMVLEKDEEIQYDTSI